MKNTTEGKSNDMSKNTYPIESVDLFITEQCNLNCSYCFHPKTAAVMTIEEGKKIIDRLQELYPDKMGLSFFGGEPMLYPETVLALAEYAIPKWKKLCLSVVTNGTYFDTEVFTRMKELGFTVQVSIDGNEETNAKYRGGDFKKICENAKNILQIFPNASVRMTFTPENVNFLTTNVQFVHRDLGFIKVMHHAVIEAPWDDASLQEYQRQLELLYGYSQFCIKSGIPFEFAFIDKPFNILAGNSKVEPEFCGAGKTYVAILNNGDVYACHRAASARIFKLGNLFDEVPIIRGMFLSLEKGASEECMKCAAVNTCHSCVVTNYKVNGALTIPVKPHCGICQIENYTAKKYHVQQAIDRANQNTMVLAQTVQDLTKKIDTLYDISAKLFTLVKGKEDEPSK